MSRWPAGRRLTGISSPTVRELDSAVAAIEQAVTQAAYGPRLLVGRQAAAFSAAALPLCRWVQVIQLGRIGTATAPDGCVAPSARTRAISERALRLWSDSNALIQPIIDSGREMAARAIARIVAQSP